MKRKINKNKGDYPLIIYNIQIKYLGHKMQCWICGEDADTGEHKIKKSFLSKYYKENFANKDMLHVKEGKFSKLPGPNSKKIKYINSLCANCNNSKTQAFDFAYETFVEYFMLNKKRILERRVIDFFDVYGEDFPKQQTNLFKYFVKIFGCHLNDNRLPVPKDLIHLFDKDHFQTKLKITFSVHETKLLMDVGDSPGMSGNGTLCARQNESRTQFLPPYKWDTFFSYLHICYWYDSHIYGPFGSPWIADARFIYLGYTNIQLEEWRLRFI